LCRPCGYQLLPDGQLITPFSAAVAGCGRGCVFDFVCIVLVCGSPSNRDNKDALAVAIEAPSLSDTFEEEQQKI
jgi:hypothetical protein